MHPADHDFIFFRVFRFLKICFIHIFVNPTVTQTNFLYTKTLAKGRSNVPTALGHMVMRRPSIGQTISVAGVSSDGLTIRHQLAAIALILPPKAWEYVV